MSADPEALLAKYQNDFAAYENFLLRDAQTPPNPQQHLPLPPKQSQQKPLRVDPNETILEMNEDEEEMDEEGRENGHNRRPNPHDAVANRGEGAGGHHQPSSSTTAAATAQRDTSNSPTARPPAPRTTSAASAATIARAIAVHGELDGPACDPRPQSRVNHPNSNSDRNSFNEKNTSRTPSLSMSSAPRPLYNAHTTPVNARCHTSMGQLDEIDHLIEARLQSAGRYRSSAPADAMYIKSQAWRLRRRQINDALRREQEQLELMECTFQPKLGPAAEAETESNYLPPVEDEGPYAAAGVTVTEDPGVAQHLKRQEEARRRRREAQERLEGNGHPRWTGRTTKTQEFKLGGRVAEPISSLRKPCVPGEGEVEPWLAGARSAKSLSKPRIAFGTVLSAGKITVAPSNSSSDNRKSIRGKRTGANGAAVKQRSNEQSVSEGDGHHPLIGAPPSPSQQQHNTKEERAMNTGDCDPDVVLDGGSTATTLPVYGVERGARDSQDLVRRLSDQLAHKDAIIQEQMEDLERMHRELEAVKETLQQIASLGTARR